MRPMARSGARIQFQVALVTLVRVVAVKMPWAARQGITQIPYTRTDSAQEFLAPGNCIRIMEVQLPLVLVVPCSKLVLTNSPKVFLRVQLTNSALWMRSRSRANLVSTSWAGGGIVKKQTRFGTLARIL